MSAGSLWEFAGKCPWTCLVQAKFCASFSRLCRFSPLLLNAPRVANGDDSTKHLSIYTRSRNVLCIWFWTKCQSCMQKVRYNLPNNTLNLCCLAYDDVLVVLGIGSIKTLGKAQLKSQVLSFMNPWLKQRRLALCIGTTNFKGSLLSSIWLLWCLILPNVKIPQLLYSSYYFYCSCVVPFLSPKPQ